MGLAPFFERARQSAAQVLGHRDGDALERRLGEVVLTIAFDTQAASSVEGLAGLDMAARLASRLYPRIRVLPLDGDGALADELIALMRTINPDIEIVSEVDGGEVMLVAGPSAVPAGDVVYMGSDRWLARVSTTAPVGCGGSANPFGAGAAACIAMANVFRMVFGRWLPKPDLDADVTMSLLDFEMGKNVGNGDIGLGLDIGLVQLVGVGAIGNAFIWAMSRTVGIAGMIHLIDHETIDLTNLQRYVLAGMSDVDGSKVALGATSLDRSGIATACFPTTWAGYVAGMGHHRFDTVAVALDTARDRVQVQSTLPRRIVNGWTQAGDLGVSRHGFGGEDACLACLYLPAGNRRNEDEIVAGELGFGPAHLLRIRGMLHLGQPVDEGFVREIATNLGIDPEILAPFVGLSLRAFRQKAICGNAIMRAADGGGSDVEVPMAFQSALAGVMMAAEVVAAASGSRGGPPAVRTVVDLMRKLPTRIGLPARRGVPGSARCMCEDPDYVKAYDRKYRTA